MYAQLFPAHKGSLSLTHNEHKSLYQAAEEWLTDNEYSPTDPSGPGWLRWTSPEERQKAIDADSIWTLHWYPETPVGFYTISASDLDTLLEASRNLDSPEANPASPKA